MREVILVTGGCGYLGSQLIRDLLEDPEASYRTVRILDNMQGRHFRALMDLPRGRNKCEFIEGDLLDPAAVRLSLRGVDTVVHLAALVRTPMSFENPAWLEQVNHWGTTQLVEACLVAEVGRFVFASSSAVYGPGGPFKEDDFCRPPAPYARSKYLAEEAVRGATERGLRATIIRFATFYGYAPAIRFDAVPNRFAFLAALGRPLTVYGTGKQKRPFVSVEDGSRSILYFLQDDHTIGRTFNVAEENYSILDLCEALEGAEVRFTEQDFRTHFSFEVDTTAVRQTGWLPKTRIQEGLRQLRQRFQSVSSFKVPRSS